MADEPPFISVHVYRNRRDDVRGREALHFCRSCGGWYGVPHTGSHCQRGATDTWAVTRCACRFCREAAGLPVEGSFGFTTSEQEWQP
jgi:hypothetical protein